MCNTPTVDLLKPNLTWTEYLREGRNTLLSPKDFNTLILEIQTKSRGGVAYSISELRKEVEQRIRHLFTLKKKLHLLPFKIPECTLNVYVNMIKCQSIFNLHNSVGNKTESRHVAEWSIRSTLAYTMVVATTHFLPDITATKYHPKKKDLSPTSIELWDYAEKAYNKMLGNESNDHTLSPVLPNLVTTTDEVTLFATTSIVNSKETLYLK